MNYLSVENLTKSYDEKVLFEDLSFGLDQGQKAALVGINGTGKSTLLKVLAGKEMQDSGVVSFRKDLKVSMLDQHPIFDGEDTILQAVFSGDTEELIAIRDYELAMYKASSDPDAATDLSKVLERLDALNAWEYEHQVKAILGQLGLHQLDQQMKNLSGGQQKRVALAKALVVNPDFLILDEPTNHLDLSLIEWLENYLAAANLTLLMVTHDRYFLDRVTNEILEIDFGKIFRYKGNYSHFLEKKAERQESEAASVDKAKNLYKTELDWIRRQPKARGTKAKYRVDAFAEVKKKAHSSRVDQQMEVNLTGERQGKKILELRRVSKSFESMKLVEDFSHVFKRKEKAGIIGSNGVGKSTFLNLIVSHLKPDNGSIEVGQTTKFGYYTQDEAIFDPDKKVIEVIQEVAEVITLNNGSTVTASQLLNQFLFPPKMQYNFVGKLSGGEKRRLQLLRVFMANPNFLILDESTNDLDITTLNILENYLKDFEGCLLVVSHDRYFMDRLVDHLFVFEGGGKIRDFPGNYSEFRQQENLPELKELTGEMSTTTNSKKSSNSGNNTIPKKGNGKKLSFNETREIGELEKAIEKLEEEKGVLEQAMVNEENYEVLQNIGLQLQSIKEKLEAKEMRWLELSEL
ncbi:MAG: ABC-F family ATP-binding cassette domain-containing protein [Bacteroidota bacterium]